MLIKSVERPRLIVGAAVGGVALFGAVIALLLNQPEDEPSVIATPIIVPVAVPVVVQPPAPPPLPPPAPAPVSQPEPRATSPLLEARCIAPLDNSGDASDGCGWDDGFPAISADGKTIVAKEFPEDGGRGNPGLYLQFIDVATSKVTRVKILDPDEYDENGKYAKLVAKRVASTQKKLAHYRTLAVLDSSTSPRAEKMRDAIRVVDGTRQLFQHEYAGTEATNDSPCSSVEVVEVQAWFDAETRTLVTSTTESFGPSCFCGGGQSFYTYALTD